MAGAMGCSTSCSSFLLGLGHRFGRPAESQAPPQGLRPWNPAEAPPPDLRWKRCFQTLARERTPWTHIFVRCALL